LWRLVSFWLYGPLSWGEFWGEWLFPATSGLWSQDMSSVCWKVGDLCRIPLGPNDFFPMLCSWTWPRQMQGTSPSGARTDMTPISILFKDHMYHMIIHSWNQFQVIWGQKKILDFVKFCQTVFENHKYLDIWGLASH
jgi:hypothetical protein